MAEIIAALKNSEEGTMSLISSGDILVEGKYYLLKNNVLLNGNRDVRIPQTDVLRVGSRTVSSRKKLIGGIFMFAAAGFLRGIRQMILSHISAISDTVDEIGDYAGIAEEISGISGNNSNSSVVGSAAETIGNVSSDISDVLGQVGNVINITAIILFILSIFILIKYLLGKKEYIEINTEYGSFCILKRGISDDRINEFVSHYKLY